VQKARWKPLRAPAAICLAALLLICLYSVFAVHRVIASNTSNNPPPPTFALRTAYRDVTYCNSQRLDVYVPSGAASRPLPLAIFVHGGGMQQGDKTDLSPTFLNALAGAGYAVASLNYRLADASLN